MENTCITVIVPCYNCEEYIEENLKSILNQTYKNFEVICIDDGSEDKTLEILKKYEKRNDRMKVIHTKNNGVASARNIGLDNAKRRLCNIY